jgi:asparagine synthase (glutamine-hydrolysing)
MCGINGIYNYQLLALSEPKLLIEQMNRQIAHRGPDDEGCWSNKRDSLHFGHRRLSILDLSKAGHQPMQWNDSDDCLVYNGEIYNYQELIKKEGFTNLRSDTDTEVLLSLLQKHGKKALQQLNGMFAFAFWDSKTESLLIARDRAGQKPLYYTQQAGFFAFASELKSLLNLSWVKKELDEAAFYDFLTFNQMRPPQTMFKGIHKLAPAHFLEVKKNGEVEIKEYWQASNQVQKSSEIQSADKIYSLLQDSVRLRMRSDVPVGAFLSGGVDSSAVVGLMNQFTDQAVSTFSIGFKGQAAYDEQAYADKVAKLFNTNHYQKTVEPQDFKDLLPKMVDVFDEPLADTTCIPIYFLSQLAKEKGNKVILTGDGADELWGGYRNWQKYLKLQPYYEAYCKLPRVIKSSISNYYGNKKAGSPIHEMLQRAVYNQDFFWSSASGFKENSKRQFLSKSFLERNPKLDSYHSIIAMKESYQTWDQGRNIDFLHYLSYIGFKDVVPNQFLYRLDKLSMIHAVEGRTPFLDHRLIDLAFQTPSGLKTKNQEPKYILKKSLERLLPQEVLYRKKMGFCVPLAEWGSEIMLDDIDRNLKSFCNDFELFDYQALSKVINDVKSGNNLHLNRLWTLYFLMNWFKRWMR